jgi:hypothetical protein
VHGLATGHECLGAFFRIRFDQLFGALLGGTGVVRRLAASGSCRLLAGRGATTRLRRARARTRLAFLVQFHEFVFANGASAIGALVASAMPAA